MNKKIFVIDYGSQGIKVMLAEVDATDTVNVKAVEMLKCRVADRGIVTSPASVEDPLRKLKVRLENLSCMTGRKLGKAYVTYGGFSVNSCLMGFTQTYDELHEVDSEEYDDIKRNVIEQNFDTIAEETKTRRDNLESYNLLPIDFEVDGMKTNWKPGTQGRDFKWMCVNVYGMKDMATKSKNTLSRVVNMAGAELGILGECTAFMGVGDKENGAVVIDFGDETTSICMVRENRVRGVAVIPFGGRSVTRDIAKKWNLMESVAEELKKKYGYADVEGMTDGENIEITVQNIEAGEDKKIQRKEMAKVIEARMDEILEAVCGEIDDKDEWGRLQMGVIMTGGGSKLGGLKEMIEKKTGMKVRMGKIVNSEKFVVSSEDLLKPEYAKLYGMIVEAKNMEDCSMEMEKSVPLTPTTQLTGTGGKKKKPKKGGVKFGVKIWNLFDDVFIDRENELEQSQTNNNSYQTKEK